MIGRTMSRFHTLPLFIFGLLGLLAFSNAKAQNLGEAIQLTGVVVEGKDALPIPGVYVILPKANRGVVTNNYGYFSMAVQPGDSIVFSFVGYQRKHFVIPQKATSPLSLIVDLKEDITVLNEVTIYPYPTEEIFKENFLALQLPDEKQYQNMRQNLSQEQINRMMLNSGMSASENYKAYANQQFNTLSNRNFAPTSNFLNPFAWAKFIKSIRNGELKRKDK